MERFVGIIMDKLQIVSILNKKVNLLKEKLLLSNAVIAKNYTVHSEALINENDFCIAYLTCFRHPQERATDLVIDVSFKSKVMILEANVCWSDGSFIESLGAVEIPLSAPDDLVIALEDFFDQLIENDLKKYSDFILQQKDEPN
jgi:hypothetical protein